MLDWRWYEHDLKYIVNGLIKQWREPQGGILWPDQGRYSQAMVKYEDSLDK